MSIALFAHGVTSATRARCGSQHNKGGKTVASVEGDPPSDEAPINIPRAANRRCGIPSCWRRIEQLVPVDDLAVVGISSIGTLRTHQRLPAIGCRSVLRSRFCQVNQSVSAFRRDAVDVGLKAPVHPEVAIIGSSVALKWCCKARCAEWPITRSEQLTDEQSGTADSQAGQPQGPPSEKL